MNIYIYEYTQLTVKLPLNSLGLNPFYLDYDSSQNQHWTWKWKPYTLVSWISVG